MMYPRGLHTALVLVASYLALVTCSDTSPSSYLSSVHVAEHGVRSGCRPAVHTRITWEGHTILLNLSLSESVRTSDIPVLLGHENGSTTPWKPPKDLTHICIYQDMLHLAAFNSRQIPGLPVNLEGSFHYSGHRFSLKPSRKSPKRLRRTSARNHYVVSDLGFSPSNFPTRSRRKRASSVKYTVELLLVIDFEEYKKWYAYEGNNNRDTAIDEIRYYYSHVANEMDLRYRSIESRDMNVVLTGFYICETAATSTFTENHKNSNGNVQAGVALEAFKVWLNQRSGLPTNDHAMLITGFDLYDVSNGQTQSSITGQAYVGEVCRYGRVSLVEDKGLFSTASIAAHELGHSLGAGHDGTADPNCLSDDQYIMTPLMDERTPDNYHNIYRFSSCSIQEFTVKIESLDSQGSNCMINSGTVYNQAEWDGYLASKPGNRYTLDQQCYSIYGQGSYFCGTLSDLPELCQHLICYDASRTTCYKLSSPGALDYSSCGDQKWCYHGECVYNANALPANEECFFGDYIGTLWEDTMTCAEMAIDAPWLCYIEVNKELCCASCASIDSGIEACEYGDHASWCADLDPTGCYLNEPACCKRCAAFSTGRTGCEYGDKVNWCADTTSADCYNANIKDYCCDTCLPHYTGVASCLYGDRASGCSSDMCASNSYACCRTCGDPNDFTTTTTVATTTTTVVTTTSNGSTFITSLTTIPDCEYGDSSTGCQPWHCGGSTAAECCATCNPTDTGGGGGDGDTGTGVTSGDTGGGDGGTGGGDTGTGGTSGGDGGGGDPVNSNPDDPTSVSDPQQNTTNSAATDSDMTTQGSGSWGVRGSHVHWALATVTVVAHNFLKLVSYHR